MDKNTLTIIGAAWELGGKVAGCHKGPDALQDFFASVKSVPALSWPPFIEQANGASLPELCQQLADVTQQTILDKKHFTVMGGDHSCAIGTWKGVANALEEQIGLIWIDAHMDSHIPATSPSGAVHGMPLACLLGYGDPAFVTMGNMNQIVNPKNLCLVGVRSFEPEEAALLHKLGVRVFFIDEVKSRGMEEVMQEAIAIASNENLKFGLSVDLDVIDPIDAPGVGSPVADGLQAKALFNSLDCIANNPAFIGMEIAELNPELDKDNKTIRIAVELIQHVFNNNRKKQNESDHRTGKPLLRA
jgi:arginase